MFGLSFGEIVILGVIALVVVGPRRLPTVLRTAGQLIGKVRRMAMDIRAESGIDEILDAEGIRSEIDHFRRLASGEIVPDEPARRIVPDREREFPRVGADAYGALSEEILPYTPPPPDEPPLAAAIDNSAVSLEPPRTAENGAVATENGASAAEGDNRSAATEIAAPSPVVTTTNNDGGMTAPPGAEVKT